MVDSASTSGPPRWRAVARASARSLAGVLPVGLFALVLLWAMGEWGVAVGILAGTALGAIVAWCLTRLIAAYPLVQSVAAAAMGLLLILVVLSFY